VYVCVYIYIFTPSFHACPLSRVSDADMCIYTLFVTLLVQLLGCNNGGGGGIFFGGGGGIF